MFLHLWIHQKEERVDLTKVLSFAPSVFLERWAPLAGSLSPPLAEATIRAGWRAWSGDSCGSWDAAPGAAPRSLLTRGWH